MIVFREKPIALLIDAGGEEFMNERSSFFSVFREEHIVTVAGNGRSECREYVAFDQHESSTAVLYFKWLINAKGVALSPCD